MRRRTAAQRAAYLFWGVVGSGVLVGSTVPLAWLLGGSATLSMTAFEVCLAMMRYIWGVAEPQATISPFAGVLVLGLMASGLWAWGRGLVAWWRTQRLLARSAPYCPGRWPTLEAALVSLPCCRQRLRILTVSYPVACTVGLWRPQIVLSTSLVAALSPAECSTVVGHEWGHVSHRDPLAWGSAVGPGHAISPDGV